MKRSTLALLRCPTCHASLALQPDGGGEVIEAGDLVCAACERRYPIRDSVPRFVSVDELAGLNRRFARFYDVISPLYDLSIRLAFLPMGGERRARAEILERLELDGGRLLEVSIGTGANLPYLFEAPGVGEVVGLDISAGQVARCRRRVARRGWPVDLCLGTAEALPFRAASFDGVLHVGGINFFSGKREAIAEMARVARPGSKIVIADETERVAQLYDRLPGFSRSQRGRKADTAVPVHLVPDGMLDVRVADIWHAHGQPHGYCLEFRTPETA
jgi:ubiquinone/menaquinone biosynthesis C-methylase UbiE